MNTYYGLIKIRHRSGECYKDIIIEVQKALSKSTCHDFVAIRRHMSLTATSRSTLLHCRIISYKMMDTQTATLSEFFVPYIGISIMRKTFFDGSVVIGSSGKRGDCGCGC